MITTAREMMVAFLHGIQKEDAEGVPAEKFNYWINKAQEDWMTERSRQFDLDQKRIDDLFRLRTEREINTNGSRTPSGNISVRIMSDNTGIILVEPERYFNISGLAFIPDEGNAGAKTTAEVDIVTGEVNDVATGDIFYVVISYSELEYPIISKVTVTASGVPSTIFHTYTGSAILTGTLMLAAVADFRTAEVTLYADVWGASNALLTAAAGNLPDFMAPIDYRFLVPNGYPNPKYFRLLNVLFKMTYKDNEIFPDGISNWIRAQLMRADQRADIYQNPYRFPTDEKPYYRLVGEFIEFVTETDSTPYKMKIEYLRYPRAIKYVEPQSDDVAIDCELGPFQQKEIVDMAVRMYIEATQSPRYQSQIVEEQIKDKFE